MKNFIIDKSLLYIKKYYNYSDIKISEIKYGLEAIYLSITKFIIVSIIALILNIFKEMILFTLFYNILRIPSFGLHATKSWICLLSTTITFLGIPFICMNINLDVSIKLIICIIGIIFMYKNSPADTYKRPIVSKKRRKIYKIISIILTIIYMFLCLFIKNPFLSNCFLFSIIFQNFMISPMIYKIFGLPYNNYINFLKTHPEYAD